ncbi:MAG: hypothetical protein R3A48_03475 [Polyangiales bacterium]
MSVNTAPGRARIHDSTGRAVSSPRVARRAPPLTSMCSASRLFKSQIAAGARRLRAAARSGSSTAAARSISSRTAGNRRSTSSHASSSRPSSGRSRLSSTGMSAKVVARATQTASSGTEGSASARAPPAKRPASAAALRRARRAERSRPRAPVPAVRPMTCAEAPAASTRGETSRPHIARTSIAAARIAAPTPGAMSRARSMGMRGRRTAWRW